MRAHMRPCVALFGKWMTNDGMSSGQINGKYSARVYADPQGTGAWLVQWRVDGRRKTRSFATKSVAEAAARDIIKDLAEHGASASRVDMAEWRRWVDFKAEIGDASLADVLAVWRAHLATQSAALVSVPDAVDKYLHLRDSEGIKGDSYSQAKVTTKRFAAAMGDCRLGEVTPDDVRSWLAGLADAGFAPLSVRNHYKHAHALFARAVREGWVASSVMDRIEPPKVLPEEITVLSAADAAKLFAVNRDKPVIMRLALEAFGGLRYSSACRLRKDDINWTERGILLPAELHKSGRRHYLEGLPVNLWSWLNKWRDDPRPWAMTPRQILSDKSAAFARAGVSNPGNVLRHSFASYHVALHSDAGKTAVLLQHTNQAMLYRHYKGVATKADAERYFGIV